MKFASKNLRSRRKRKTNNNTDFTVNDSATSTPQPVVNVDNNTPSCSNVSKGFKELDNRSESKISANNIFERSFENSPSKKGRALTRSMTNKFGLRSKRSAPKLANKYKIIDTQMLNEALKCTSVCKSCCNPKSSLLLSTVKKAKIGLAEKLCLKCSHCKSTHTFESSKRMGHRKPYDINYRSVYASQTMGLTSLVDFCSKMGFPQPVSQKSYQNITDTLTKTSTDITEELMNDAALRLRKLKHPDPTSSDIANIAVSVDGTWQRRGYTSKIGIVFVIALETGEVVDYEIKCLYCQQCATQKCKLPSASFNAWYEKHEPYCKINHKGSSSAIETVAAVEMFLRSVSKRSLRYTTYVGDGDSSSFASVREECLNKFGPSYTVTKEECQGHVQKRMGSALKELKRKSGKTKLDDGKTMGGKGRLTERIMDKIQNSYGYAIRGNSDKDSMKNAIMAVLKHTVIDEGLPLDQQHALCPRDRWCRYWKDPVNYSQHNRLPPVFYKLLLPIFERLSNDELLSRCLLGLTQNQNEAINNVLWSRCLKTKFCGVKKVSLAVSETVAYFNAGAGTTALLMKKSGINPCGEAIRSFRSKDQSRVVSAARKISLKARIRRQKLRAFKKSKNQVTVDYAAGAFGLKKTPETYVKPNNPTKPKIPKKPKSKLDPQLKNDQNVLVSRANIESSPVNSVRNELKELPEDIQLTFVSDEDTLVIH